MDLVPERETNSWKHFFETMKCILSQVKHRKESDILQIKINKRNKYIETPVLKDQCD